MGGGDLRRFRVAHLPGRPGDDAARRLEPACARFRSRDRRPRAAAQWRARNRRDPAAGAGLGLDLRDRRRADRRLGRHRPHDHGQPGAAQYRPDHLRHPGHRLHRAGFRPSVQGAQPQALSVEPGLNRLAIEAVVKQFPGVRGGAVTRALERIDLSVEDNDFLCILGPSGCGKSTLLRIVAGLETPTTGCVLLDAQPVSRPGPDRGMVFQSYTLFPWLTIEQNILFGARSTHAKAADLISRVGLKGFENHYPKMLSGGMQQRTALARALANDPKILLLDEPFGALDHQTRALMQELLLGIWEADRKTVLFVTHDIDEAIFMANRVAVMSARPGRIKADVRIELPHPRHYTMKTAPAFSAYKAQLTEEIRTEALKAVEMQHA